eukprot:1141032-Pelagomonas_calceolata.AAC.5
MATMLSCSLHVRMHLHIVNEDALVPFMQLHVGEDVDVMASANACGSVVVHCFHDCRKSSKPMEGMHA